MRVNYLIGQMSDGFQQWTMKIVEILLVLGVTYMRSLSLRSDSKIPYASNICSKTNVNINALLCRCWGHIPYYLLQCKIKENTTYSNIRTRYAFAKVVQENRFLSFCELSFRLVVWVAAVNTAFFCVVYLANRSIFTS